MDGNAHAPKDADSVHAHDRSLLNGSSLTHLSGASVSSRVVTEVRVPASRMAEVLERIHQLGDTGSLQVNFHKGRALDMKWTGTRETKSEK